MRKTITALAVGLALAAGPASAVSTLRITGFMAGGQTVKGLHVFSGSSWLHNRSFAAGAFNWSLDGVVEETPLYCVDVFHSFYWGQQWQVEAIPVPPGPLDPPPYNTLEAGWVYQKYGRNMAMASGVQLALWEITHDKNWRTQAVGAGGDVRWWVGGDFYYTGSTTASAYVQANLILQDLFDHYSTAGVGHSTYYRPVDPQTDYFAQGQLGDGNPIVPEPGMLVLVGIALAGAAGASWRRRQQR